MTEIGLNKYALETELYSRRDDMWQEIRKDGNKTRLLCLQADVLSPAGPSEVIFLYSSHPPLVSIYPQTNYRSVMICWESGNDSHRISATLGSYTKTPFRNAVMSYKHYRFSGACKHNHTDCDFQKCLCPRPPVIVNYIAGVCGALRNGGWASLRMQNVCLKCTWKFFVFKHG